MCTVTWERSADGYELYCSRDERFSRSPAVAPRVFQQGGLGCLAPIDSDFGGSWIGVNALGLTVCLLNGCDPFVPTCPVVSRGELVVRALASRSIDEFLCCLDLRDLSCFRAFTLLGVSGQGLSAAVVWNGRNLVQNVASEFSQPFTSSSFEPGRVLPFRTALYQGSSLRGHSFHSSHAGGPGPLSVCMHRSDASTVSFTHVSVQRMKMSMLYSPQPPCLGLRGEWIRIPGAMAA
jgi:hypothetical protein